MMFEYRTITGERVTINPKMITVIQEVGENECKVFTADSEVSTRLKESYEKVREDFNKFMYSFQTNLTV